MSLENLKTIESISLDFYNNNIKTINVKQLDMKSRYVKISCTEHGKFYTLNPNIMSAFVRCKKPDGSFVLNDCPITSDGTLLLELTQQMLAVAGKCIVDIMLFDTNLVEDNTNGDVELSKKGVTLNKLTVTDDSNGNVSVSVDTDNDFTIQGHTADTIEDIYNLNVPVLSTMTFYLNVLPTAIEHTDIESSYEYNALVQGIKNQELIEKHMISLDATLNVNDDKRQVAEESRQESEALRNAAEEIRINNENQRISNEKTRQENEKNRVSAESQRKNNESQRQTNETSRNAAEKTRDSNETQRRAAETDRKNAEESRITNEQARQENETLRKSAETTREIKTNDAITECNTATNAAIQATDKANSAATTAATATSNADKASVNAEAATTACINATANVGEAIANCNIATGSANEAAALCQSVIDQTGVVLKENIVNNLEASTAGCVLDATQGSILYQMIQELKVKLQAQIDSIPEVHTGYTEPVSSIGKNGDIYMMIVEESVETVGE